MHYIFYQLTNPPVSPLFPYTTLFRRVLFRSGGLVPAGGEDRVGELPAAADRRERLVGDDPPGGPVVLGQTSAALLARPIVLSVLVRADDQASVGAVAVLVVDFPLSLRGQLVVQIEHLRRSERGQVEFEDQTDRKSTRLN